LVGAAISSLTAVTLVLSNGNTAKSVTNVHDISIEEYIKFGPSTAVEISLGSQETVPSSGFVGEAHVRVEHDLVVSVALHVLINALPLVFVSVAIDFKLWAPALQEKRAVVIVVELSLVRCVTPVTIESRVRDSRLTQGVRARNSGSEPPCVRLIH